MVSKTILKHKMTPFLEGMNGSLITKNVGADISGKLCESVAASLNYNVSISFMINYESLIYSYFLCLCFFNI